MKTLKEITLNQIRLQKKMQKSGLNLVTCGNCGCVIIHETKNEYIDCPDCLSKLENCDCPDIYFTGMIKH